MNTEILTKELQNFIEGLRLAGYNIGTTQFIAAQNIILALLAQGKLPTEIARLKTLLGAVLCHSPKEQAEFAKHFDNWTNQIEPLVTPKATPASEMTSSHSEIKESANIQATFNTKTTFVKIKSVVRQIYPKMATLLRWLFIIVADVFQIIIDFLKFWEYPQRFLARKVTLIRPNLEYLFVQNIEKNLFDSVKLLWIAKHLCLPTPIASKQLDIEQTLEKTTQAAGLFSPVMDSLQTIPQYLVLIDKISAIDHQAHFIDALIEQLIAKGVFITRYYFYMDPRTCYPEQKPLIPLFIEELAILYPKHLLMIFSESSRFINNSTHLVFHWMTQFSHWQQRVLFTLEPPECWGNQQQLLEKVDFLLLPANEAGLAIYAQQITNTWHPKSSEQEPEPELEIGSAEFPISLSEMPEKWIEDHAPDTTVQTEMLIQIWDFLGKEGYYWFSACAVYPELYWQLTLHLGYQLTSAAGQKLFNTSVLTKLVRLPWFRYGHMPNWLRTRLVKDLSVSQENQIRTILQNLLLTALDKPLSGFSLPIAKPNTAFSAQRLLQRLKLSKPDVEQSYLRDYVFPTFITSSLAVRFPKRVRHLLLGESPSIESLKTSQEASMKTITPLEKSTPSIEKKLSLQNLIEETTSEQKQIKTEISQVEEELAEKKLEKPRIQVNFSYPYHFLELELREQQPHTGAYEVELFTPFENRSPIVEEFNIAYDPNNPATQALLDKLEFEPFSQQILPFVADEPPQILKEKLGIPFFHALFKGQILAYYQKAINHAIETSAPLNIQLHIKAPQLVNVPWEYMYDDQWLNDFLSLCPKINISLTRFLTSNFHLNTKLIETPFSPPLRILVIISKPRQPAKYANIDEHLEKEWLKKLGSATPKRLEMDIVENPASFAKLTEKFIEKQYDILHFLGHGDVEGENGFLIFEEEGKRKLGGIERISGKRLATALAHQKQLRLIFLNSCLTGHNPGKSFFGSVATALLKHSNVPYVVAMQFEVADEVGATFAEHFYYHLATDKTIDKTIAEATSAARSSVFEQNYRTKRDIYKMQWGIPVCYTQYNPRAQKNRLLQEIHDLESKEAYEDALLKCEQFQRIDPSNSEIAEIIQRLTDKKQLTEKIANLVNQVIVFLKDDLMLAQQVKQRLEKMTQTGVEDTKVLKLVESFVEKSKNLDSESFQFELEYLFKPAWEKFSNKEDTLNYQTIATNLKRGKIVLFLGSEIPHLFDTNMPTPEKVVPLLAKKANIDENHFHGSLAMMAQYLQMKEGRTYIVNEIQNLLKTTSPTTPPLYPLLANIQQPLIVISDTYDTLLENTFKNAGKKYVLISPYIATNTYDVQIIVKYSDKEKPESYDLLEDHLFQLSPLEEGYSLIYKIRGYFDEYLDEQENQLILTEENYSTFAYHVEKLIPKYFVQKYRHLGFLFLGYTPKQQEDRLIVDAILKKHAQKNEPSYTIRQNIAPYEIEYWKYRNIRIYEIELTEFVQKLAENL